LVGSRVFCLVCHLRFPSFFPFSQLFGGNSFRFVILKEWKRNLQLLLKGSKDSFSYLTIDSEVVLKKKAVPLRVYPDVLRLGNLNSICLFILTFADEERILWSDIGFYNVQEKVINLNIFKNPPGKKLGKNFDFSLN
jgi:hypothetical protein